MVLCDRDGVTLTDDDDDGGKVDSFVSKKEKRGTSKTGAGSDTNQNTLYLSSSDLQHPVLTAMIKKCSERNDSHSALISYLQWSEEQMGPEDAAATTRSIW